MQTIQWFPGHMAKAKREISEKMKLVDLVIELKDARIPYSSTNPMIDEIAGNKPRLILLCKAGIADKQVTKMWMDYYKSKNIISLDIDCITGYHIRDVESYAKLALKDVLEKKKARGIVGASIKAMIVGIPNVGKSTLINTLAKRKAAATGDKPGVTKSQTWIKVTDDFILLDTPGILWPKFEDQMVGVKLAMCGSIKDEILNIQGIALESVNYMDQYYPEFLKKRYNLDDIGKTPEDTIDLIGKKRGCLLKGGEIDRERVYVIILNELRSVKIGAMSYERPEEEN